MPVECPQCGKSLDRVTLCLNVNAKVHEDGTVVIPDMPPPARIQYLIEEMGEEIIICRECDAAMSRTATGNLKFITLGTAKVIRRREIGQGAAGGADASDSLGKILS